MKNKLNLLVIFPVLILVILFAAFIPNTFSFQSKKVPVVSNTVSYGYDIASFPNPERGMYSQMAFSNDEAHNYTAQDLTGVKQNFNISTFRIYYFIDNYLNTSLPQTFLDKLEQDATKFREAGLKFMPTFTYVPNEGITDAGVTRILAHIDQITPFLQLRSQIGRASCRERV